MAGFGIEVEFEEFVFGGKTLRNVIGRIEGSVHPEEVSIIGAHYDSISQNPMVYAPGADDNASGVAAVLEAARILAGYDLAGSVEFICFGGEEQGRQGAKHNAGQAAQAGKNIVGMINLDMIGYWPSSSDKELDIGKNVASAWLADAVESAADAYAALPVHNWPDTGMCHDDHVEYWAQGYDAIVLMDCYEAHADPGGSGESTPYYHSVGDTIGTLDLAQTTEAVRSAVAAIGGLAVPILFDLALTVSKGSHRPDVVLAWNGGIPPFTLEASTTKDFSSGVVELTPPAGTFGKQWVHPDVLDDGVDYYYRVRGQSAP
jgi:Zn-dependent M28 family amino/carboxypeptidase